MHYFSPVDKIELLEIIRSKQTSDETVCSTINLALKQGKIVIVINDGPGFYTTRLLAFLTVEIFSLLQDGLTPEDIDKATKKFGFHLGLASLIDEYGIDLITHIIIYLQQIFDERLTNSSIIELLKLLIKNQYFGRKSKQGLYIYQEKKTKIINSKLKEFIQSTKQM